MLNLIKKVVNHFQEKVEIDKTVYKFSNKGKMDHRNYMRIRWNTNNYGNGNMNER
jgi:hypothetical protein